MTTTQRSFEFLTLTPHNQDPANKTLDEKIRYTVRSHATRSRAWQKRDQLNPTQPEDEVLSSSGVEKAKRPGRYSAASLQEKKSGLKKRAEKGSLPPLSALKGRFRLGKSGGVSKSHAPTSASRKRAEEKSKTAEREKSPDVLKSPRLPRQAALINHFVPDLFTRFDPFDSLPIYFGPTQEALLAYQNSAFRTSSFSYEARNLLFSQAASDAAWLSATLSLIALHRDLSRGRTLSQECLMYRGEALRLVNQRLGSSPPDVSNATIGAVASLANFDIANGIEESASMHRNGLIQIIELRGGIQALDDVPILQKTASGTDLSYSIIWESKPRLPVVKVPTCPWNLPDYLDSATKAYNHRPEYLYSPLDLVGEMSTLFQCLRLLSLAVLQAQPVSVIPNLSKVRVLGCGMYLTDWTLLTILDESSVSATTSPGSLSSTSASSPSEDITTPEFVDPIINRSSHIYGSTRLAAYLYLYLGLRQVPLSAPLTRTLGQRLVGVLGLEKRRSSLLLDIWSTDLILLLWICVIGSAATEWDAVHVNLREFMQPSSNHTSSLSKETQSGSYPSGYPTDTRKSATSYWLFIKTATAICRRLGVDSHEGLEMQLRQILWLQGWSEDVCASAWGEIERLLQKGERS